MKTLKFVPELIPLILNGSKTSTWRLFDDKNLQTGDVITCINSVDLTPFTTIRVIEVIEKPFKKLSQQDKQGHEVYQNKEEMYQVFSNMYHQPVGPETIVKILKFELLNNLGY